MTIDLTPFCATEETRFDLQLPFSRGTYTYASNGILIVRVPRRDDVADGTVKADRIMDDVADQECTATLPPFDLPESDPVSPPSPCEACDGLGYVLRCERCHGEGHIECCECGHETDCPECGCTGERNVGRDADGAPTTPRDHADALACDSCGGAGEVDDEPDPIIYCEIAPGVHVASYLLRLLRLLPGLRFCPHPFDNTAHRFTFDGGDGAFMPLRPPRENDARIASILRFPSSPEAA